MNYALRDIEVQDGDIVLADCNGKRLCFVKLVEPNTEDSEEYCLPYGGAVIFEMNGAVLYTTEHLSEDEDIQFIRRASEAESEDS
jgi:hypothetical protein